MDKTELKHILLGDIPRPSNARLPGGIESGDYVAVVVEVLEQVTSEWNTYVSERMSEKEDVFWEGHAAGVKFAREYTGYCKCKSSQTIHKSW